MGLNKLPNNIDLEDLFKALENGKEISDDFEDTEVIDFLTFYKIIPGDKYVKSQMLYDLYKAWAMEPIPKTSFSIILSKFLNKEPTNPAYYINFSAFKVSAMVFKALKQSRRDKTKSYRYQKHFENFLNKYNIQRGSTYVPFYLLFYLYDRWVYDINKSRPFSKYYLTKFFAIYFKYKKTAKGRYYAVDNCIIQHLSPQTVKEITEGIRLSEEKKKTSSKSKKTNTTISK